MRKMIKRLTLALALLFLLNISPWWVFYAEAATYSGSCGSGLKWTFDTGTGVMTISGNGNMNDYYANATPWADFCDTIKTVEFDGNVTSVGRYAFFGCYSLTSISIPDSVTTIGDNAFEECERLKNVTLGNGVTKIGSYAFFDCPSIERISIPESVISIGDEAFSDCISLVDIVIPDSVVRVGRRAFDGCDQLYSAQMGKGMISISEYMFANCSRLIAVKIPANITIIDYGAFFMCDWLTQVYYGGTEEMWKDVKVGDLNTSLRNAMLILYCDHENTGINNAKEATCTEDGYTGDKYCEDCGEIIKTGETIPALGHKYDNNKCIRCGDVYSPFVDVKGSDYFYTPVLWAVQKGITNGTTSTTFSPYDPCTRGQIVTFLWRAFGSPEPEKDENPFTDVTENMYYYKAILWAVEQGITTGTSATTFSPEATCTRGQVATFLWRACGKPAPEGSENPFTDVPETVYYYEPILWAVENGITNGTGNGKFSPEDSCTRGQIVTFLYRALAE